MAYNGSGTFNLSDSIANATPGDADELMAILTDLANGLTAAVAKDGQSTMTGPLKASNGTASAPSYTFGSDTNSGFYRIGADSVGLAVNGTLLVTFDSSGITLASGDVLGTGIIKTAGLENNAVTLAKLATQADATVLANVSGSTAVPTAVTYTNLFNDAFGSTQGTIIYKGASDWAALGVGTNGQYLKTQGAGANPAWATVNEVPSVSSNGGKVLQTDGSTASWSGDSAVRARASVTDCTSATCTVGTGAVNVASVTHSSSVYTVTFTSALASANYQVIPVIADPVLSDQILNAVGSKTTTGFTITCRRATGALSSPNAIDFVVFGGF